MIQWLALTFQMVKLIELHDRSKLTGCFWSSRRSVIRWNLEEIRHWWYVSVEKHHWWYGYPSFDETSRDVDKFSTADCNFLSHTCLVLANHFDPMEVCRKEITAKKVSLAQVDRRWNNTNVKPATLVSHNTRICRFASENKPFRETRLRKILSLRSRWIQVQRQNLNTLAI